MCVYILLRLLLGVDVGVVVVEGVASVVGWLTVAIVLEDLLVLLEVLLLLSSDLLVEALSLLFGQRGVGKWVIHRVVDVLTTELLLAVSAAELLLPESSVWLLAEAAELLLLWVSSVESHCFFFSNVLSLRV